MAWKDTKANDPCKHKPTSFTSLEIPYNHEHPNQGFPKGPTGISHLLSYLSCNIVLLPLFYYIKEGLRGQKEQNQEPENSQPLQKSEMGNSTLENLTEKMIILTKTHEHSSSR
jgi:hypothetical protein